MTTATISRKVTKGEELVVIPRSEYEKFTRWQEMHEKTFTPTRAEKNDLKKARKALGHEELKPSVAKMLEKQSRALDAGKGIELRNMKEYRAFVRSL